MNRETTSSQSSVSEIVFHLSCAKSLLSSLCNVNLQQVYHRIRREEQNINLNVLQVFVNSLFSNPRWRVYREQDPLSLGCDLRATIGAV